MHRRTLGYIEEPSDQDPAQGLPVPVLGGGRAGCDNGADSERPERRDSKEALMLTDPPTARSTDGPLDRVFPVGHHPPRQILPPHVACVLWHARKQSGLTNSNAAAQIGIDPSYLSKLVRGARCPSSATVERLIAVLPLTAEEKEALRAAAVQNAGKSRLPG